jgi:hypothetical protein
VAGVKRGLVFYKAPSGYAIFAGTDCTVSLAKMSLTGEFNNKLNETVFTEEETEIVEQWHQKYLTKYNKVGTIKY